MQRSAQNYQKIQYSAILKAMTTEGSMETRLHFFIRLFGSNCLGHYMRFFYLLWSAKYLTFGIPVSTTDHTFVESVYSENIKNPYYVLYSDRKHSCFYY